MRKLVLAIVLASMLALGLGGAVVAAETPPPPPTVTEFSFVQTYHDTDFYWAPAVYYGETVTIVYEATNRHFFIGKNHHFSLRLEGTATVYAGEDTTGALLDERPFSNTETFRDPENDWGWPARWWEDVGRYYYKWTIPGVYDCTIRCKDGHWTMIQVAHTTPPTRGGVGPSTPPFEYDAP